MAEEASRRQRGLGISAGTIDADIVIRERRTLWAPATVLLFWGIHELVHPHQDSWLVKAAFIGASVAAVLVEFVLYPAWITVGPRGLGYGQWFQRRKFLWADIDSFAVGNPERPEVAYVLVRAKAASTAPHARRLPRVSSHSPEHLVSVLRAKQRLFTEPVMEDNRGVESKERRGAG